MVYLPDASYLSHFETLTWPLPRKLLPWLYKQGLGIYVLPPEKSKARNIVHERLKVKEKKVSKHDKRLLYKTAHFDGNKKAIIIPHRCFYAKRSGNIFAHEVGHAADFFIGRRHGWLSWRSDFWKALHKMGPLDEYCAKKFKKNRNLIEQFATGFAAYFLEPEADGNLATVENLSKDFISLLQKEVISPFE